MDKYRGEFAKGSEHEAALVITGVRHVKPVTADHAAAVKKEIQIDPPRPPSLAPDAPEPPLDPEQRFEEFGGGERGFQAGDGVQKIGLRRAADRRGPIDPGEPGDPDAGQAVHLPDGVCKMFTPGTEVGAEADIGPDDRTRPPFPSRNHGAIIRCLGPRFFRRAGNRSPSKNSEFFLDSEFLLSVLSRPLKIFSAFQTEEDGPSESLGGTTHLNGGCTWLKRSLKQA